MSRFARGCVAVVLIVAYATSANAQDAVTVRYLDGHPPPNMSTEWINLRVARVNAAIVDDTSKQDVDRFFERVAAALTKNAVTKDWQLAIPDVPAIEITVELGGKKLKLVSCHTVLEGKGNYVVTEHGGQAVADKNRAAVLAKQSESFRRHRAAFEEILRLTTERVGARLSP